MSGSPAIPEVRIARSDDREAVEALWRVLQEEHEALDPHYKLAEDADVRWRTDFRDRIGEHAGRIWVIESGVQIVGYLSAHLMAPPPLYRDRLIVHVDDVYVRPPWRGLGLGRRLVDLAAAWGRDAGAEELRAGVLVANRGSCRFWRSLGMRDYALTVSKSLSDPLGEEEPPADTRRT